MPCHHGPVSVDFDPVKIGPRPRRIDPVRAVILVVAVGLAVAIVKPWAIGEPSDTPPPSLAAAAPRSRRACRRRPARPRERPGPPLRPAYRPPTWDEVEPVIEAHDAWGVRAILLARRQNLGSGPDPRFKELWSRTSPNSSTVEIARVARDDEAIVALGITFPSDIEPLDMRIWRLHAERRDRMDRRSAARLRPTATARSRSSDPIRPGVAVVGRRPLPGRSACRRPALFDRRPDPGSIRAPFPPRMTGRRRPRPTSSGPRMSDPSGVRSGPFATVDGRRRAPWGPGQPS